MQLYVFAPSPNSLCCQAVANHAGLDVEIINVDLSAGAHMQPDFIALNPNHKIPTLADGDFVLWESGAVMAYLAQQAPESGLMPADARLSGQVLQWLFWRTAHFGPACGVYTFERLVKPMFGMGETDEQAIENVADDFHRFSQVLNEHLRGRDCMVGDQVTIADHAIVSWLYCAEPAGYPLQDYAEIQRWAGAMLSSSAWQDALATIPSP